MAIGEKTILDLEPEDVVGNDHILPIVDPTDTDQSFLGSTLRTTVAVLFTNRTLFGVVTALGDILLSGVLRFQSAVAKIIGGSTSISIRNNTDTEDNLLILNNGDTSIRGNLSVAGTGTITGSLASGPLTASGLIRGTRLAGSGPAPVPTRVSGTDIGTPTLTAGSSDIGGTITATIPVGVSTASAVYRITFGTAYPSIPSVLLNTWAIKPPVPTYFPVVLTRRAVTTTYVEFELTVDPATLAADANVFVSYHVVQNG